MLMKRLSSKRTILEFESYYSAMKLPSIDYLYQNAKSSFLRFPLTILSALVAVIIAVYLTEYNKEIDNFFPFVNSMLTAALGIPLFF